LTDLSWFSPLTWETSPANRSRLSVTSSLRNPTPMQMLGLKSWTTLRRR
jgi:hypothetical protein